MSHPLRQKYWRGAMCWCKNQVAGYRRSFLLALEDGELLLFCLTIVALIWGTVLFCAQYVAISSIACSCSHQDCFSCWDWSEGLEAVRWGKYQRCYFSWCQREGSEDIITYSGHQSATGHWTSAPSLSAIKCVNANMLAFLAMYQEKFDVVLVAI